MGSQACTVGIGKVKWVKNKTYVHTKVKSSGTFIRMVVRLAVASQYGGVCVWVGSGTNGEIVVPFGYVGTYLRYIAH